MIDLQPFWDAMIMCRGRIDRQKLLIRYAQIRLASRTPKEVSALRLKHRKQWRAWLREDSQCGCCHELPNELGHHIVLLAHGGSTEMDNLFPICGDCHFTVHEAAKYHPNISAQRFAPKPPSGPWACDDCEQMSAACHAHENSNVCPDCGQPSCYGHETTIENS